MIALFVTNMRALVGWKLVGTLLILAAGGAYLVFRFGVTTDRAYEWLQIIFGVAAIGGGASLYSAEREAGTFELLWLATGSERVLLRLKIVTMMVALGLLLVPTVVIAAKISPAPLPILQTCVFLLINCYLILAVMTFVSTFLPQSWAGGFVGAALLAAIYLSLRGNDFAIAPFRNPFLETGNGSPSMGHAVVNRIFVVGVAIFFVDAAARRLRRSL